MIIARVIGSAVSTIKVDSLHGSKLLIVQRASTSDELEGDPFVAVDAIGAGMGAGATVRPLPRCCRNWRSACITERTACST